VQGLSDQDAFTNITFELKKGEILGFAGLVGAGRTELAQTIFGLRTPLHGRILLLGKQFLPRSPRQAIEAGIAYVPEDRKTVGLFLEMMLSENIVAPQLFRFTNFGLLNTNQSIDLTNIYIEKVGINARNPFQKAKTLSGGNQQKLLLAMWLALNPHVLIVDEPTRGIDVGAKLEIHDILINLAREGMAIILISSELPEILSMSDRIVVMHEGEIAGILSRESANQEIIMRLASGLGQGETLPNGKSNR
jgi:ABC-type sugar transport system ATPase subunit